MINGYLNQSCTISHATGSFDSFGNPVTQDTTADCRFVGKTKQITGQTGNILISTARVLLDADTDISPGDIVTFGEQEWRAEVVAGAYDLDGNLLHRVVYLS